MRSGRSVRRAPAPPRHSCALQTRLDGVPAQRLVEVLGQPVVPVYRNELGFEPLAQDPRRPITAYAGQRAPPQRAVDVNRATGDNFSSGAHGSEHRHVALRGARSSGRSRRSRRRRGKMGGARPPLRLAGPGARLPAPTSFRPSRSPLRAGVALARAGLPRFGDVADLSASLASASAALVLSPSVTGAISVGCG